MKHDEIYKLCTALDNDGSGAITLDEFLLYFSSVEDDDVATDFEKRKEEEELYENIWPQWVVKSNQVDTAKGFLGKMFDILANKHGVTAEQAFGIYDVKDSGRTSIADFKRVLKIFFDDVLSTDADVQFIIDLT